MDAILDRVRADFPHLSFFEGPQFSWHAHKMSVSYKKVADNEDQSVWSLLHELGHALLDHTDYTSDVQLVQMEVAAWEYARNLAETYGAEIDEDYIQDCLDTYRDWLHVRATCPTCLARSLQASETRYRCFNCQTEWTVTRSRLCRPYRLQTA